MKKRLIAMGLMLFLLLGACTGLTEKTGQNDFEIEGNTLVKYLGKSETVTVPEGIEIIDKKAFEWCYGIKEIILPETLKEIRAFAFRGCRKLKNLRIPASVVNLNTDEDGSNYNPFWDVDELKAFEVDPDNPNYTAVDGVLFTKDRKTLVAYPDGKNPGGKYVIPEGTESVSYAFYNATLKSISIPDSLSVKLRPWNFTIRTLQEYTVGKDNPLYSAINGVLYSKDGTVLISYPAGKVGRALKPDDFPESVTTIGERAFEDNTQLKSIFLPDRITEIEYGAFYDCDALQEITIPASVTMIPRFAFGYCEQLRSATICNPEAVFEDEDPDIFTECEKVIVRAPAGSTTEAWCTANNVPFLDMNLTEEEAKARTEALNYVTQGTTLLRYIGQEKDLVIPEGVVEIGAKALYNNESVRSVQFPSTLKKIGEEAFAYCGEITSVTFQEGLEEIGERAFYGNKKLKSIQLPSSLKIIGESGFAYHGLEKILQLPEGLEEIGAYAFEAGGNSHLQEVRFPSTIRKIGEGAFKRNNLKTLEWPAGTKTIEKECFYGCQLTKVILPEGLEQIADQAFAANDSLKKIQFPSTLKYIGERAFAACSLTGLQFPENLEEIGRYAFSWNKLSNVTIPAGVRKIGEGAFNRRDGKVLSQITFLGPDPEVEGCLVAERDYYTKSTKDKAPSLTVVCYPGTSMDLLYCSNVKKKYLSWGPEHTRTTPAETVLPAGLYAPEDYVAELIIPEGVEEIADGAFSGLKTLQKVTFPPTLKKIGAHAFENCVALNGIKLPAGLESIGEAAFKGCVKLQVIELPAGLTEVADETFRGCKGLSKLKMAKTGIVRIGASAFADCGTLKTIDLPGGLQTLGTGAFAGSGLTGLKLPAGLPEVPDRLCAECGDLKSVTLPAGITRIGKEAFTCCWSLGAVQIPEGVTVIDEMAFYMDARTVQAYYVYLKKSASRLSVKFPASLETIRDRAFCGCDALGDLSFPKGALLKEIGKEAFAMCIKLKNVKLPETVETIGESAFVNCVNLGKADLGQSLKQLQAGAFSHDEKMTSLTVPDTLTEIGDNILEGCGKKLTVVCGADSAMENWLKANAPEITIKNPKK